MAMTDLAEKEAVLGGAITPTRYGLVLATKHVWDPYYMSHGGPEGEGPYDPFPGAVLFAEADLGAYGGAGTPDQPPPWYCVYPNAYPTTTNQYLLHWTAGHGPFSSPLYGYYNIRGIETNDANNDLKIDADYRWGYTQTIDLPAGSFDITGDLDPNFVSVTRLYGFPASFFGPALNIGYIFLNRPGGGSGSTKVTHFGIGFYNEPFP